MMAYLRLNRLYKVYPNGVKAVNDFSIDIEDKEFIVFVGPSGCGKSTTLRMVAGLEEITAGELFIEDKLVNDIEAEDRDIAMVFQNYALYPHMTVYENMAFGLRNRKIKENVIKEKINEAVRILDLESYLDKKPKEMSGGQRQRVALGRAIVRNPKVFLFDEPLSNLDAKLRASMRSEITKLHKKLETTFIYVTHDQVEAMTMGTRIVVMKDGYVQQIDTPMNLYYKPQNKFVAGFIGTPQMNFFTVTLTRKKNDVIIKFNEDTFYTIPYDSVAKLDDKYLNGTQAVTLGIRPEHFVLSEDDTGLKLMVNAIERLGNEVIVYGDFDQNLDDFTMSDDAQSIIIKAPEETDIDAGVAINLGLKVDKLHFFDIDSEELILKDIPNHTTITANVKNGKINLFGKDIPLPPAYLNALPTIGDVTVQIPPDSIIAGNTFKLRVANIEKIGVNNLLHLKVQDKYLFVTVQPDAKVEEDYAFSLQFDKLTIIVNGKEILTPIAPQQAISGQLVRTKTKENGKRVTNYHFLIAGHNFLISKEKAEKLLTIDGRHSYKMNYKFVLNQEDILLNDNTGIPVTVLDKLDYGQSAYVKLQLNSEEILLKIDPKQKVSDQCFVTLDLDKAEVWHPQINFRII